MKIFICLAHNYPSFDRNFVMDLIRMQNYFRDWCRENKREDTLNVLLHGGYNLDKMRDNVTEEALANDADVLLFLDTDMTFPQETVARLLSVLESNKEYDAVTGLYVAKREPYLPQLFSKFDNRRKKFIRVAAFPLDKPFPIEGAGAGVLMVWARAIKKLKPPYWKFIYDGEDKKLPYGMGEDLYFCWKLLKAKCKMFCDPIVNCGHYDTRPVTINNYIKKNNLSVKSGQIYMTKRDLAKLEKLVKLKYTRTKKVR